jgi:hypothetical protein
MGFTLERLDVEVRLLDDFVVLVAMTFGNWRPSSGRPWSCLISISRRMNQIVQDTNAEIFEEISKTQTSVVRRRKSELSFRETSNHRARDPEELL